MSTEPAESSTYYRQRFVEEREKKRHYKSLASLARGTAGAPPASPASAAPAPAPPPEPTRARLSEKERRKFLQLAEQL